MPSEVRLRPATVDDAGLLAGWDREPHVIACSTDDPDADIAFGGIEWREELSDQSEVSFYRIAEVDGRAIGVMQVIDPHREPTRYWGDIEPNLRALDIWIGPKDAHRFYQRLGFEPVGRRMFDADDCLVHRLFRERWEARS